MQRTDILALAKRLEWPKPRRTDMDEAARQLRTLVDELDDMTRRQQRTDAAVFRSRRGETG